jgi:pectate lyase
MMKNNYYENNLSIGFAIDFELSYQGVKESPYYNDMHKDGKLVDKYVSPAKEKRLKEEADALLRNTKITVVLDNEKFVASTIYKYEYLEGIDEGKHAEVYKGKSLETGEFVAIKDFKKAKKRHIKEEI